MIEPKMRVISLGAGVQSTVMALMAEKGEIGPRPDCAIFADTEWEPKRVYEHLEWLRAELSFPVHIVKKSNLREDLLRNAAGKTVGGRSTIPAFVMGADGRSAPLSRQCTRDYKVDPIRRKVRELLGVAPGRRVPKGLVVEQWIGISTDEAIRMKPSRDNFNVHRWPLIEARMNRSDCLAWFGRHYPGRELAKSSCIGCPYHSDVAWRDIKNNDPDGWKDAVELDRSIRGGFMGSTAGHAYLHRSMKPLDEVDLSTAEERGQPDLFNNDCEGMCGV